MLLNRKIKYIFIPIYLTWFSFLSIKSKAEINLNQINDTKTIINKPDLKNALLDHAIFMEELNLEKIFFTSFILLTLEVKLKKLISLTKNKKILLLEFLQAKELL